MNQGDGGNNQFGGGGPWGPPQGPQGQGPSYAPAQSQPPPAQQGGSGPPPGGPPGYGPPQGYGPPPGGPQGYGPPPGGPQGYGPPPGVPQGYGPPPGQGYGPPPAYGPPQGYGPPPGYGPQPGPFGGSSYGAPPGPPGWGPPPGVGVPFGSVGYAGHGMRTKSSPVGAGIGLAVLGAFVGFVAYVLWEAGAHGGYGGSFAGALFMGGGLTLVVLGVVKALEKKIPAWAYGAIAGVFVLLFTAMGPSVSASHHVEKEKKLFKECQNSTNPYDWTLKYEKDVPEKFQRKEWRLEWMRTRIREAKSQSRVADLRTIANECDAHADADLLAPAKEEAVDALKTFYDAGKQKMFASRTGSVEFPVDNLLREGFATVIDELARSKDPNVYVLFKNQADLAEPAQQKVAYKLYADDPLVRKAFPKGNPPEIKVGDAFSPKFDQRRRTTFIQAMTESFAQVFDGSLITLVPLDGTDRKKKVVIEVSSRLRRVPDYFMYTKELPGGGETVAGLLFNFEVDWDFELFSNTGRSLYKGPLTTSKPSDTKFDSGVGNPDWVPYSVMMDSAYFNYSREVTGRFGLVPPPKKEYFVFTP